MAILNAGNNIERIIIGGHDVNKVIYNGAQIWPNGQPAPSYHIMGDFTSAGASGQLPSGRGGTGNYYVDSSGISAPAGEWVTLSFPSNFPDLTNASKVKIVVGFDVNGDFAAASAMGNSNNYEAETDIMSYCGSSYYELPSYVGRSAFSDSFDGSCQYNGVLTITYDLENLTFNQEILGDEFDYTLTNEDVAAVRTCNKYDFIFIPGNNRALTVKSIDIYVWYGSSPTPLSTPGIYHNSALGLISYSEDGETWLTIADKDLGATTLGGQGNLYQWGNNNPFTVSGWRQTIKSTTQVNASSYGPNNPYSSNIYIANGTWYSNWDSSNNTSLWNGNGPCPSGYHVPTNGDILYLFDVLRRFAGSLDYDACKDLIFAYGSNSTIYNHMSNPYIRTDSDIWTRMNDWSGGEPKYVDDLDSGSSIRISTYGSTNGHPIRPVKDVPVLPDNTWVVLAQ